MASTVNITIQDNLEAINLGINDAESTVVVTIVDGSNGYTPIKGVDYFDGRDGTDWSNVSVNNINQVAGNITLTVADIPNAENSTNKQNSLAVDGTNTKYPTVTAVNSGLAGKQNVMGADDNYVTDAQLVVISNTSGTNTGDETTTTIGALINNSTAYNGVIDDLDKFPILDASDIPMKHTLWSNIKARLKTYFDTLYKPTFSENTGFNKNFGTTAGTVCEGNDSRLDKNKTIASTVTPASHTGSTAETILGTPLTIPANTFIANDEMVIRLSGNTINVGSGIKTFKIYLNTTPNLTGTPIQINQLFTLAGATVGVRFIRNYDIENTNLIKANISGATNLSNDYTNNGVFTTYTPNLGVIQYLIPVGKLDNAADTITLQSLRILRNRP